MNDLVSIIIPVYNREDIVRKAIISSLNQDYRNIELVLVDDGSTDNTLQVLKYFEANYPNIKVIHQENSGALQARLTGFNNSNGNFISFLDSDDIINSHYISGLLEAQKLNDANITLARMRLLCLPYKKFPETFNIKDKRELLPTIWVGNVGKLFKKEAVLINDYGLTVNEDLALTYFNLVRNQTIASNSKSMYTIRPSKNSLVKEFLRTNIRHVGNVLRPLEIEKQLFMENGYFYDYYHELEAIFIHNILELIKNINLSNMANSSQKRELVACLIQYLNYNFPNWKDNKYYKAKFANGSIYSIYFALATVITVKKNNSNEKLNYDDTISQYNDILTKKK